MIASESLRPFQVVIEKVWRWAAQGCGRQYAGERIKADPEFCPGGFGLLRQDL